MGVPDDNEQGFGPRDGHIETLGVGQEAQNVLEVIPQHQLVWAHLRYDEFTKGWVKTIAVSRFDIAAGAHGWFLLIG